MSERPRLSLRRRWPLLVVAGAVLAILAGTELRPSGALRIEVVEPPAATLEELVGRADLVVVARIVSLEEGRVVSGAADPGRAVRTQLARLAVDDVTLGEGRGSLILEEVTALADGTPATVEGLRPSRVGDAGLFFLVRQGPQGWAALAGPQGRYLLDPEQPDRLIPPLPDDPLATELAALGPRGLRAAVLASGG